MALTLKQAASVLLALDDVDGLVKCEGKIEAAQIVASDIARGLGLKPETPKVLRVLAEVCDALALEFEEQATLVKEALNETNGTVEIGEVSND